MIGLVKGVSLATKPTAVEIALSCAYVEMQATLNEWEGAGMHISEHEYDVIARVQRVLTEALAEVGVDTCELSW